MATVLSWLGFAPRDASLQAFDYAVQRPPERGHTKARYMNRREVDACVEPYIEDLRAGAPDAWVAGRAGLTENQVKAARHRLNIMRSPGRQAGWRHWLAVSAFGTEPVVMRTDSEVGGRWQVPQYVLRRPLAYRELVRVVVAASTAGMSAPTIARGVGVRVSDIEAAQALGDRL